MQLMMSASRTKLLEFKPARIVSTILLSGVISLSALRAFERHHWPISLRLLGHCTTSLLPESFGSGQYFAGLTDVSVRQPRDFNT